MLKLNTQIKICALILTASFSLITNSTGYGTKGTHPSSIEEYENRRAVCVSKKGSAPRSNISFSVKRIARNKTIFYKYTETGSGDYDKYTDVRWKVDAEMREIEGILCPVYADRVIRDKGGDVVVRYEKRFDYNRRMVDYASYDGRGRRIKSESFAIKGKIADNNTLLYFLKAFVPYSGEEGYRSFYLISSEPRMYKIDIEVIGTEALSVAAREIKAVKMRLIPDLGLLTVLTGAFVPPTYVWYAEEPPYAWLQYEGLEAGLGSSHIIARISG